MGCVRRLHQEHGYSASWTAPNGEVLVNTYLELGCWKYWVIFPVINRERIENSTTVRLDENGSSPRGLT